MGTSKWQRNHGLNWCGNPPESAKHTFAVIAELILAFIVVHKWVLLVLLICVQGGAQIVAIGVAACKKASTILLQTSKILQLAWVVAFTETHVQIKDLESDAELSLSVDSMRFLRLGWACTFASIQGRTLRAHTRIWDADHKNFGVRQLAMAIGRMTMPENLDIA